VIRPPRSRAAAFGALGALCCVAAACGIPTSTSARVIPPNQVPANLLAPVPAPTTTTQPKSYVEVPIYLVSGVQEHLASVPRDIVTPPTLTATLTEVIDALLQGPAATESANGYFTAIPPQTRLLSVSVSAGIATVNFNAFFATLTGQAQLQAVGQVVLSTTAQQGVTQVAFEIQGQPAAVPIGPTGAVVAGPVTAAQYAGV
jgi:spore germination protein GerM